VAQHAAAVAAQSSTALIALWHMIDYDASKTNQSAEETSADTGRAHMNVKQQAG
jgi:hypothetical protein